MANYTEVFKQQDRRIRDLQIRNKSLIALMTVFMIIAVLLAAYVVYIELEEPAFGKWKRLQQEKQQTEQYNDYLLSRIDSVARFNDLLMENSPNYSGVFFEVQIGAFKEFNLQQYQESLQNLRTYQENDLNKYVLGKFRSYDMAQTFLKDIQRMGISDAFIIAKIDGKRVELKTALVAARERNQNKF